MPLRSIFLSPVGRYFRTKRTFKQAANYAEKKEKPLMMIGDPCSGNYFQFMSNWFPNCDHGDITIDLYGREKCHRMDINDMDSWRSFEDDSFVIMETGVLGFSEDIASVASQIARVSGGEFFSAGGNKDFFWESILYKTYSKKLNYTMNPFDFRESIAYTGRRLGRKERISINFSDLIDGA